MDIDASTRVKLYQVTVALSVVFALIGFSYNVWRLELSEHNNTARSACFEMLIQLSEFEQLVYAAHYDKDETAGNPRRGWIKVGLIADLSVATEDEVTVAAETLRSVWAVNWEKMPNDRQAVDKIVAGVDNTRAAVQAVLKTLD